MSRKRTAYRYGVWGRQGIILFLWNEKEMLILTPDGVLPVWWRGADASEGVWVVLHACVLVGG